MKRNLSTILLIAVFFIGLSLLLYPSVSDYWNSFTQSRAIASYAEAVADIDREQYDHIWQEARTHNAALAQRDNAYTLTDEQAAQYEQLLNVSGTGVMGYIEIPAINCSLPLYHGTDPAVLQVAIGHLEWTSLPVGGLNSHCVVSGHRGLPSAKLFTDLDQMEAGDLFMLRVLDEVLTYEVDQILIVLPQEIQSLQIVPGEDLCTLVTCTPYGVNSHRLLVRGHRVENQEAATVVRVTADAMQIEPLLVAPIVAAPMLLALVILVMLPKKPKHKPKGGDTGETK